MTDRTTYAPCVFFAYDDRPQEHCLLLSDDAMVSVADVFEAAGHVGNGYDWEGVARSAVRSHAPELAGRFSCDPEAGMFVAYGEDEAALRRLGELLHRAYADRALLAELIAGAGEWLD